MYTGYRGVGALEPARKDTVREASNPKAAAGGSRRPCRAGVFSGAAEVRLMGRLRFTTMIRQTCLSDWKCTDLSGTVNPVNARTVSQARPDPEAATGAAATAPAKAAARLS